MTPRSRKIGRDLGIGVLFVGGLIVCVYAMISAFQRPARKAPEHYDLNIDNAAAAQVDQKMAPLAARFTAPEGPTPCESAYNAWKASAEATGDKATFRVPAKDVFLARCGGLPEEQQMCLTAAYEVTHRSTCEPLFHGIAGQVFDIAGH